MKLTSSSSSRRISTCDIHSVCCGHNTTCNHLVVFTMALADQQHSFGGTVQIAQPVVGSSNTHSSWAVSNTQLYTPVLLPLRCSSQQVPALLHSVPCCSCTGPTSPGT